MSRRPVVVYIAGPYRADTPYAVERNVREAEAAALAVWRAGGAAICPHTMSRFYAGAFPETAALAGTLELLRRSDAVLLLRRWQTSEGARAEKAEAERLGIPVFYPCPDGFAVIKGLRDLIDIGGPLHITRERFIVDLDEDRDDRPRVGSLVADDDELVPMSVVIGGEE